MWRRRSGWRPRTGAALREPSSSDYINAAQIYPYSENALYRLLHGPQEVSDIALQPGETLAAISAGDTVRWAVGDTASGTGETAQVHVLVKPFAAGLSTDLVILTDRHSYHLKLQSTEHTSMAAVSWTILATIWSLPAWHHLRPHRQLRLIAG